MCSLLTCLGDDSRDGGGDTGGRASGSDVVCGASLQVCGGGGGGGD